MPDDFEKLPPAGLDGSPPAGLDDALPARPEIGPAPDGRRLGWPELVVAAVAYVAIQLVLAAVLLSVYGGLPPAPLLFVSSAVAAFGAVAVALGIRVRAPVALGVRPVAWRTVGVAALLGAAVWFVSRVLIVVYVLVTGDRSDPQAALTQFDGAGAAVVAVVLGGLVVPLGEELLFRGVGYGALRRYGPIVAGAVSSLLFALAHGLNVVFPAVLVLAVLNAVLYERTRSIWPCVATHVTFNLLSLVLLLVVR